MIAVPQFTATQIERLAFLIKWFSIIGGELLFQRSKMYQISYVELLNFRSNDKELLEIVHSLALKNGAISPLRLTEALERSPTDTVQAIILAQRCMRTTAFLSHCIAMSGKQVSSPPMGVSDMRVH